MVVILIAPSLVFFGGPKFKFVFFVTTPHDSVQVGIACVGRTCELHGYASHLSGTAW